MARKKTSTAAGRRPSQVGKPKGKPLGMKGIKKGMAEAKARGEKVTVTKKAQQAAKKKQEAKAKQEAQEKEETAKEFRLEIKPDVEIFWSYNANSWTVACEAKSGKKMSMKVATPVVAASVKSKALDRGTVNPNYWMGEIRKHPLDIVPPTMIIDILEGIPGLTQGISDHQDIKVWHVWMKDGLNGTDQTPPVELWQAAASKLTRSEIGRLQMLVDIYEAGFNYAMTCVGGKGKKK